MSNAGDEGGLLVKIIVGVFGSGMALKFVQFLTSLRSGEAVAAERAALMAERASVMKEREQIAQERTEIAEENRQLRVDLDASSDRNAILVGKNATQAADLRELRRRVQEREGRPFELDEDAHSDNGKDEPPKGS